MVMSAPPARWPAIAHLTKAGAQMLTKLFIKKNEYFPRGMSVGIVSLIIRSSKYVCMKHLQRR